MRIEEGESSHLSDCVPNSDATRTIRGDIHGAGLPSTHERTNAVPAQKDGTSGSQQEGEARRFAQDAGDARDTHTNQKKIGDRTEGNDQEHVLAPQTLAENEGVLSADRDNQRCADNESGSEG